MCGPAWGLANLHILNQYLFNIIFVNCYILFAITILENLCALISSLDSSLKKKKNVFVGGDLVCMCVACRRRD